MVLPDGVRRIIRRLNEAGFEAWAVGGCVRDMLLGRCPKDWDITTSALPLQIKSTFERTVDTGIEHGTVTVLLAGESYEVTTYRIDGKYTDARHPDSVEFSRSLEEDLKRRDFTINAMAYSEEEGLVDLFGGMDDLEKRILRCVGDPTERFSEDALRILRAVRFSAELDLIIDAATLAAAQSLRGNLSLISAERIHAELEKMLLSDHPDRLRVICETGIDEIILPELKALSDRDPARLDSLIDRLERAPADKRIRWALFLSATGSTTTLLRRLKFDNNTIHAVSELLRLENVPLTGLSDHEMRKVMNTAGADNMPLLFDFRCILDPDISYAAALEQYHRIMAAGDCTSIKELAVNGSDLIACGIPAGKEVGEALSRLLEAVLADPAANTKDTLLGMIKELRS